MSEKKFKIDKKRDLLDLLKRGVKIRGQETKEIKSLIKEDLIEILKDEKGDYYSLKD